ncbi:hypothetical protein DYQ94_20295 [Xanthomonas sp. LMG 8993]|nr:hypothetical protein [Xanthomonas sp. LMG 8993]QWM98226.1 hypothetical protein DGN21_01885 [Xanthomonas sp. MLO165]
MRSGIVIDHNYIAKLQRSMVALARLTTRVNGPGGRGGNACDRHTGHRCARHAGPGSGGGNHDGRAAAIARRRLRTQPTRPAHLRAR